MQPESEAVTTLERAIRAYIEGESLCDSGRVQHGIRSFRAAYNLVPELESEVWPAWATDLHSRMLKAVAASAPPMLDEDAAAQLAALDAIADTLEVQHFAVIDGFAGGAAAQQLRECCTAAWERDAFRAARARPADALRGAQPAARSDFIAWDPPGFDQLSRRVDALVRALRERKPTLLGAISARQRPMVARYGYGDAFARHVDNNCCRGQGELCNGRVLTTVYYMQDADWDAETDGGCLRLFGSQQPLGEPMDTAATPLADDTPARLDVAPLMDRLVLFLSDFRCPHEVLPVRRREANRFATTIWYWNGDIPIPPWWQPEVHDCQLVEV
eukprot:jgi/Chrpa1/15880/Chrysochromulina_OHIO_Genome00022506-RA